MSYLGKVNGYAISSDFKSINLFESKTTGEWETIESYVLLVASNVESNNTQFIFVLLPVTQSLLLVK